LFLERAESRLHSVGPRQANRAARASTTADGWLPDDPDRITINVIRNPRSRWRIRTKLKGGICFLKEKIPKKFPWRGKELECAPSKRKFLNWTPLAFLNSLA
jgi:hypothetical protein